MSGPSQPKVEGEQWSDERIAGFLDLTPLDETPVDYHVLLQAYHHMTPEFFARFVEMFAQANRDFNAKSLEGETIAGRISHHAKGKAYLDALTSKGASLS